MREQIREIIIKALEKNQYPTDIDFDISFPPNLSMGDYSTNVAMVLAKKVGENPNEVSRKLSEILNEGDFQAESSGGYINFKLNKNLFLQNVQDVLEKVNKFGRNKKLQDQKIIVEYTDPNPFKQFHIGHLMSNSIGEAIARVLEWNGASVFRACYQGDVGMHVAKALWGMIERNDLFPEDGDSLSDKAKFVGEAYIYGSSKYEEDEKSKLEIEEINRKVFDFFKEEEKRENPIDQELKIYYDKGKDWSLRHFEEIYQKLGTKFDKFIFESQVAGTGEEIVRERVPEVFEMSDGAVIYDGEKDGLHKRVFINSLGIPTYEAKEIGLAFLKETIDNFDESIVITGSEQKEYFKVVMAAIKKIEETKNLGTNIFEKTSHIPHGMMRFSEGKMSSRKGNLITGESLIEDISKMVEEKISDKEFDNEKKQEIKDKVSIAALKYSVLKQSPGKDIIFDPEKSISFEGDSGPYLQYSYVRAGSLLKKASEAGLTYATTSKPDDDWQTTDLEKILVRFKDVVDQSVIFDENKHVTDINPQNISNYLIKLASEFNTFYTSHKIIDEENPVSDVSYKLALVKAVQIVLQNGLIVLGIKVPEEM